MSKVSSLLFCFTVLGLGIFANGEEESGLGIYEIKKDDFSVKVTNYGARVVSVVLPDKNGTALLEFNLFHILLFSVL